MRCVRRQRRQKANIMMNGECAPHSGSVNPKRIEYLPEEEPDWKSFVLIQAWILEELNTTF